MEFSRFWELIDSARPHAKKLPFSVACRETLLEVLLELDEPDLKGFQECFRDLMTRAYHWPLWNAIYLINDGCGDDSFFDFRDDLVARGREVYEGVLSDPEVMLEDVKELGEWLFFENHFSYAAEEAHRIKIGKLPTDQVVRYFA